jgi:hypothetical protein
MVRVRRLRLIISINLVSLKPTKFIFNIMKLEKLLELTNSKEFYQDNHLSIARIKTESDLYRNVVFDFINESQIDTDRKKNNIQKWRIPAHRCERFHDMCAGNYSYLLFK